jgi:hypothetical protein
VRLILNASVGLVAAFDLTDAEAKADSLRWGLGAAR